MASGVMYSQSTTPSAWEYGAYPHDNRLPEYAPYSPPWSHPPHRDSQYQQPHQVWAPPSRFSTGTYPDPSFLPSPPPLRHSLATDPAFASDPNTNPDSRYRLIDVQSTTPFPTRSYSGLDVPHDFVHQSSISHHPHSYHEDMTGPSSPPQPIYFIPRSDSSSSRSGSSVSHSPISGPPQSSVRRLEYPYEHSDPPPLSIPPDASYTPPDAQPRHRNGKHQPKRLSPHASQQGSNQAEEAPGAMVPFDHATADGSSHTLMSSMTALSLAEHPKDGRARTSSRASPPDFDPVDVLDNTNPYGINVHHKGPYEAVAAILNETNPIDSPLLRVKGIQQQVSASAPLRPHRHVMSEPNANPMSLNLQPGQILQSSIYQPTQPSPFPLEFSQGAFPPNHHDVRPSRRAAEPTTAEYDIATTRSPLRRNQTLPVPNPTRGLPEQSYHVSPPVASQVQAYQHPYPVDSNVHQLNAPSSFPVDNQASLPNHPPVRRRVSTAVDHPSNLDMSHNIRAPLQLAPVPSVGPSKAPPTPVYDQRLTRTLYLTNPDGSSAALGHGPRAPQLPPGPETIYPSTRAPIDSEGRSRGPRNAPPRAPDQDSPRRYEPPSQTVAAMKGVPMYAGQTASVSSSSSHASANLGPRRVPKRLVMPSPLANATESAPLTGPARPNDGRHGQVLRKRATSANMSRPDRPQSMPSSQTVNRGVFSFFRFGKGSKPTVREVRVTEPPKAFAMGEKGQVRVRTREEPRKLSKRK